VGLINEAMGRKVTDFNMWNRDDVARELGKIYDFAGN
jgi:hypothetical protein